MGDDSGAHMLYLEMLRVDNGSSGMQSILGSSARKDAALPQVPGALALSLWTSFELVRPVILLNIRELCALI